MLNNSFFISDHYDNKFKLKASLAKTLQGILTVVLF